MENDYLLKRMNKGNQITSQPDYQLNENNMSNTQSRINNSLDEDIYSLKTKITKKLNDVMAAKSGEIDESYLRTTIFNIMNEYPLADLTRKELLQEIINDINGYGILQPFLDDEGVSEIICCRYDNIWIEKFGKMIKTNAKFSSEQELRNLIDKIIQPIGRRVDDSQPYCNARLKDRSRVNIVIPPIALDGATLDIRKFSKKVFTAEDYIKFGSMTKDMANFIRWCVTGKKNIIVSGGTGSGKTTLLNFLSNYIPENEAIVTIEDTAELQLVQQNLRSLEARGKNSEGAGQVTISDLVVNSLRMRPDRIIVGEVRSYEVIDMLQAMNTGHDGSLTTGHSNGPKEMIARLYAMSLMGGYEIPEKAIKAQIASALHLVVQIQRLMDGSRKITQISEIVGFGKKGAMFNNEYVDKTGLDAKFKIKNASSSEVYLQDIFRFNSMTGKFETTGWIPTFLEEFKAKKYPLSEEIFKGGEL